MWSHKASDNNIRTLITLSHLSNVICMIHSEPNSGKKLRLRHSSSKVRSNRVASSARSLSQHSDSGGDSGIFCLEKPLKPQDLSTLIIQVCLNFKSCLSLHLKRFWKWRRFFIGVIQVIHDTFLTLPLCDIFFQKILVFNTFRLWTVKLIEKSALTLCRTPSFLSVTLFEGHLKRCFVLMTIHFSPSCHLESFNVFWNVASCKRSSQNCVTLQPNLSQMITFERRYVIHRLIILMSITSNNYKSIRPFLPSVTDLDEWSEILIFVFLLTTLKARVILEAAVAIVKIGSNLKPYHNMQV